MRLIDADELITMWVGDDEEKALKFTPKELIDKAPTIRAIPVEFMQKWLKEKGYLDQKEGIVFYCIIRDWEKESG